MVKKPSNPAMTDDDYAENIKKNPPRRVGEKPKKPGIIGRIMKKIGLREQALARAKAILEAKTYSGTGSNVLKPKEGDHVVYDGIDPDRILGIFNKADRAEKFAEEVKGYYPGVHKG